MNEILTRQIKYVYTAELCNYNTTIFVNHVWNRIICQMYKVFNEYYVKQNRKKMLVSDIIKENIVSPKSQNIFLPL